jgi:BolA family transcriptional regulator, general stress-responsive regulator
MTIKERMEDKLKAALAPTHLEVINESALHAGHAGDDGSGESHFKLVVVSSAFDGMSRLERQRYVYEILSQEIQQIHAISLMLSVEKI